MAIKQAIILAAGRGFRLRHLSDVTPKCLLSFGDGTILSRQLDSLKRIGVEQVLIVTGYQSDAIKKYAGTSWASMKLEFVENNQWHSSNNITSLAIVSEKIHGDFMLLESDLVWTDLQFAQPFGCNEAVISPFNPEIWGTHVTLDGCNNIIHFHLGETLERQLQYPELYKTVNIYTFKKDFFLNVVQPELSYEIRNGNVQMYYEKVFHTLTKRKDMSLKGKIWQKHNWYEIDTPEDYNKALFLLNSPLEQSSSS
jgi:choline kinase